MNALHGMDRYWKEVNRNSAFCRQKFKSTVTSNECIAGNG